MLVCLIYFICFVWLLFCFFLSCFVLFVCFVVFSYINMIFMILCFQMIRMLLLIYLCSMATMCYAQPPWLCRDCVVNGNRYRGNRAFQYNRDCNQYTCKCLCDGTYDCPPALTKDLCRVETEERCRVCEVRDKIYAPGPFKFVNGCFRYDCECKCDASWHCPTEKILFLCWYITSNPNTQ